MGIIPIKHHFQIGDKVTVYNPFTVHAPFMWPTAYEVIGMNEDYYTMRTRQFKATVKQIPKRWPHMSKENRAEKNIKRIVKETFDKLKIEEVAGQFVEKN
jgi:hypothetical protein